MKILSSPTKRYFCAGALILLVSFFLSYLKTTKHKDFALEEGSRKTISILMKEFDYAEKTLRFIGHKIATKTPDLDDKIIDEILMESAKIYSGNGMFSWSLFDWVNAEGYQTVNNVFGVLKTPKFIASERRYRHKGNENWEIIFCDPAIGYTSFSLVLPIGLQIETSKNKHAGSIVLGIDINQLVSGIKRDINQNIHFALIDKITGKAVFGSDGYEEIFSTHSYAEMPFTEVIDLTTKKGTKNPYRLAISYDEASFQKELFLSFVELAAQIFVTVFAAFILLKKSNKSV